MTLSPSPSPAWTLRGIADRRPTRAGVAPEARGSNPSEQLCETTSQSIWTAMPIGSVISIRSRRSVPTGMRSDSPKAAPPAGSRPPGLPAHDESTQEGGTPSRPTRPSVPNGSSGCPGGLQRDRRPGGRHRRLISPAAERGLRTFSGSHGPGCPHSSSNWLPSKGPVHLRRVLRSSRYDCLESRAALPNLPVPFSFNRTVITPAHTSRPS